MPRAVEIFCVTLATEEGPLSLCKDHGYQNRGIISFNNGFATSWGLLVLVGKTSTHLVKVSIKTRKCLHPWEDSIWVKSTCQSSLGSFLFTGWAGGGMGASVFLLCYYGSIYYRSLWSLNSLRKAHARKTCLHQASQSIFPQGERSHGVTLIFSTVMLWETLLFAP